MAAGLPGTGIGGLFFILSALFMIVVETERTVRGKSSLARWRLVSGHAAVASAMVAAVTAAVWLVHRLLFATSGRAGGHETGGVAHQLLPYLPVLITVAVLTLVLGAGYLAKFVFSRPTARVRPAAVGRTRIRAPHPAPAQPAPEPVLATRLNS